MGNYWTNAVRHPEDIGVGHIRRTVDYTEFSDAGAGGRHSPPMRCRSAASRRARSRFASATLVADGGHRRHAGAHARHGDRRRRRSRWRRTSAGRIAPAQDGGDRDVDGHAARGGHGVLRLHLGVGTTAGKATFTVEFVNKRESIVRPFPNN